MNKVFNMPWGDLVIRGVGDQNDQVFTNDRCGSFNVTRTMEWALKHGEFLTAKIDVAYTAGCIANIDLDPDLLSALRTVSDADLHRLTVLLYINTNDGTHLLIDGNHRLAEMIRRAQLARSQYIEANAIIVPLDQAEQFRVRYLAIINGQEREITPEQLLEEIAGVYSSPDGEITDRRQSCAS